MKGRITTVLSLAGVLVAGSAAAMVNTKVLQNTESKSSGEVTVASADGSNTPTAEPTAAVDPANATAVTGNMLTNTEVTKLQSSILTATQAMYQVGDAGLITLDTSGNVLTVVSVTPNSGWVVVKDENYTPTDIVVTLQNGTTIVEFKANLNAGVITTSVESRIEGGDGGNDGNGGTTPGSGSTAGGGNIPGTTSHHDDEDGHDDEGGDDGSNGGDDD
jgi:hypothetical protein